MHGKICVGDRLCSINSESIDHLPMKTIHALIDGKDGTRVSLQFEHVEMKRSQHGPEGHHVPNMVAFWASKGQRGPKDIVTTESFNLIRSNGLPLSKAADEDDWSYNQADPTWQAQEERGVGVLQVGIRAAKNLPKAGHVPLSAAGVFVRVTCADNSFSGDVVFENAVDPQFDHSFEIPVRANQQESDLILEVVHKEAFFPDIPYGSLKLPKAAAFVSKNGTQDGWYGLANQHGILSSPSLPPSGPPSRALARSLIRPCPPSRVLARSLICSCARSLGGGHAGQVRECVDHSHVTKYPTILCGQATVP
jgi:hypothetical protein